MWSGSFALPSWPPGAPSGGQLGWTLERHILERQRRVPGATGDFTGLFQQIALCAKVIGSRVNQAGLAGILGLTGKTNVQGEQVQKLDEFANDTFKQVMESGGHVCVMASEEDDEPIPVPDEHAIGKYVLLFDPLDGSSNIDVNISIGSIFSVHRRVTVGVRGTLRDCLQKGSAQVAAGYVIYGSSTMFVYTTGDGVHGFTLDPSVGEFLLSHPNITIPEKGKIYSVNEGNSGLWDEGTKAWVRWLKEPDSGTGRPYSARYVGSLVADFHRTLLKGGVFAYPADRKSPKGKLRLLYEASPMGFIAEAAGGIATDGRGNRIVDLTPTELHQRTPLLIGSRHDVETAERFFRGDLP
ncbi:MAG: class 1 fructose-bisphosphatase [Deltaproteobacteria bacterium]|nr:class 1 fructose-bisphosphatase [Deltaproteobacteria bacterium]